MPMLRSPSWTANRRPSPSSGQPSPGRSRNGARVQRPHATTQIPPIANRSAASMRGGESATPILTATVLPPHSAESSSTIATASASRSRGAWVEGAMSQSSVHSGVVKPGIPGFPASGKTPLFNLLTGAEAGVAQPPGRGRLNVGVARVPDDRVTRLSVLFQPKKTVYATVDVVDLAGFDRGERATLDVGDLRQADALLHVVRAFPSPALGGPPPAARGGAH